MRTAVFGVIVVGLVLAGCGGQHRDLIPVGKQLETRTNAHDWDGVVSLMTNDVTFKRGDGREWVGKDSVRAFMSRMNDLHMQSSGYEASGDTLKWHSTLTSAGFARMGVNPAGTNEMAVFSGDKIKYFFTDLDQQTKNKLAMVNFYNEVVNGGHLDAMDKYIASDYVERSFTPPNFDKGIAGVKMFFQMLREAYPDLHVTPILTMADGDYGFMAGTWTGTNKGKFFGRPATNKSMTWTVSDVVRFVNGKAVEHWGWDDMAQRMMTPGEK